MSIYIPLALLYIPVIVLCWLAFGWLWRTVIFAVCPGIQLGLSYGQQRALLWWGPLGAWMAFELFMDNYRAKRIREQSAKERGEG